MSRFWSPLIENLQPYVPGEQPKLANSVKLNTNENPYGPSPKVIEAIKQALGDNLRLYPDPNSAKLKQKIADYHNVNVDQVFVGNGSDEVLAHAFHALFQHEKPILFPDISYSFYPVYCQLYGIDFKLVPLNTDFEIDVADYRRDNGGIIFPNPNAPTGHLLSLVDIEALLQANTNSVLVVDEAYIDFGGQSAISLVNKYANLLVIQTLSKSRSLANLRVGFAVGHPDLIEALVRIKDSFNSYPLDGLAVEAAIASFDDQDYFEEICDKLIKQRSWVVAQLSELGFEVLPSAANFVFTRHPKMSAESIALGLREQGVIVRHFKQDRISQFLRISIGDQVQNQALIDVLTELLA